MCSALGQEALVREALESGARDYVVKPFKPDQVLAALGRALKPGEGAA
jgi:two-component system chemotaxis response regulator CheY